MTRKSINWTAVAAVGSLLGGAGAVAAVFVSRSQVQQDSTTIAGTAEAAFYTDACKVRMGALPADASDSMKQFCPCTAAALQENFDSETVRGVAEWLQAVQLGGGRKDAEDEYFASLTLRDRSRVESAYDFSIRQCSPAYQ